MSKKKRTCKFTQGYACAVANLINAWGETHLAKMLLSEGGFNKEKLIEAGVEQADIETIFNNKEYQP